jgi:hypothetical protein
MQSLEFGSGPSQWPAADDIFPDALDAYFGPKYSGTSEPPWVKLIDEPDVVSEEHLDSAKLAARLSNLKSRLVYISQRLQEANYALGYANGLIEEKDKQLDSLPYLRRQATLVLSQQSEIEMLRAKLQVLENEGNSEFHCWLCRLTSTQSPASSAPISIPRRFELSVSLLIVLTMFLYAGGIFYVGFQQRWWL